MCVGEGEGPIVRAQTPRRDLSMADTWCENHLRCERWKVEGVGVCGVFLRSHVGCSSKGARKCEIDEFTSWLNAAHINWLHNCKLFDDLFSFTASHRKMHILSDGARRHRVLMTAAKKLANRTKANSAKFIRL